MPFNKFSFSLVKFLFKNGQGALNEIVKLSIKFITKQLKFIL